MTRIELYYPRIKIPSEQWLRRALLYSDKVASIVPLEIQQFDARLPMQTEMKWLEDEGQYVKFRPDHFHSLATTLNSIFEEFATAVFSEAFRPYLPPENVRTYSMQLHGDKITNEIADFLVLNKLGRRAEDDPWWDVEPTVGRLYMGILAKHIAADPRKNLVIASTDDQLSRHIAYDLATHKEKANFAEFNWRNGLPVPTTGTSLRSIVKFKKNRAEELLQFRQVIAEFELSLKDADEKTAHDMCQTFAEKCKLEVATISRLMRESKITVALSSLRGIVTLNAPLAVATIGAALGSTTLATVPLAYYSWTFGAMAAIEIATKSIEAKCMKNKAAGSPFAYLYYAEEELAKI